MERSDILTLSDAADIHRKENVDPDIDLDNSLSFSGAIVSTQNPENKKKARPTNVSTTFEDSSLRLHDSGVKMTPSASSFHDTETSSKLLENTKKATNVSTTSEDSNLSLCDSGEQMTPSESSFHNTETSTSSDMEHVMNEKRNKRKRLSEYSVDEIDANFSECFKTSSDMEPVMNEKRNRRKRLSEYNVDKIDANFSECFKASSDTEPAMNEKRNRHKRLSEYTVDEIDANFSECFKAPSDTGPIMSEKRNRRKRLSDYSVDKIDANFSECFKESIIEATPGCAAQMCNASESTRTKEKKKRAELFDVNWTDSGGISKIFDASELKINEEKTRRKRLHDYTIETSYNNISDCFKVDTQVDEEKLKHERISNYTAETDHNMTLCFKDETLPEKSANREPTITNQTYSIVCQSLDIEGSDKITLSEVSTSSMVGKLRNETYTIPAKKTSLVPTSESSQTESRKSIEIDSNDFLVPSDEQTHFTYEISLEKESTTTSQNQSKSITNVDSEMDITLTTINSINETNQVTKSTDSGVNSIRDVTGANSIHEATGTNSIHDATVANSIHDATDANSIHEATDVNSIHEATGMNSIHDATVANSSHDATDANSIHEATGMNSIHDATVANSIHDATGANSIHEATGTNSIHDATVANSDHDDTDVILIHTPDQESKLNTCSVISINETTQATKSNNGADNIVHETEHSIQKNLTDNICDSSCSIVRDSVSVDSGKGLMDLISAEILSAKKSDTFAAEISECILGASAAASNYSVVVIGMDELTLPDFSKGGSVALNTSKELPLKTPPVMTYEEKPKRADPVFTLSAALEEHLSKGTPLLAPIPSVTNSEENLPKEESDPNLSTISVVQENQKKDSLKNAEERVNEIQSNEGAVAIVPPVLIPEDANSSCCVTPQVLPPPPEFDEGALFNITSTVLPPPATFANTILHFSHTESAQPETPDENIRAVSANSKVSPSTPATNVSTGSNFLKTPDTGGATNGSRNSQIRRSMRNKSNSKKSISIEPEPSTSSGRTSSSSRRKRSFESALSNYSLRSRPSSSSEMTNTNTVMSKGSTTMFSRSKIGRVPVSDESLTPEAPPPPKKKKTRVVKDDSLILNRLPSKPNFPKFDFYCNQRFYKYLVGKMEPKYGIMTNVKVVDLARYINNIVVRVCSMRDGYQEIVKKLKITLCKAGVIATHYDFYVFCFDYLPPLFRLKAIPMLPARGQKQNIEMDADPWAPIEV